jgi:polyferredoxin
VSKGGVLALNLKKGFYRRIKRGPIGFVRHCVQFAFLFFLLYVGLRFYQFVLHFASFGDTPFVERPDAVEGFLPISALVALKVWITTGEFDSVHPAGLTLFVFIVGSGFIFRRFFCSWICPVGTVCEWLGILGNRIFKKNIDLPKWVTGFLYPIKYILLAFFVFLIIVSMPVEAAKAFLFSPYNQISDVKMLQFFLDISQFTLIVLIILFLLSLLFRNFWCRFLCPYGAIIGLGSLLGITRISRNEESCTNCQQCSRVCPQRIKVSEKTVVFTPECTACMQCIEACPHKDTLIVKTGPKKVNKWVLPIAFFSLFLIVVVTAKLTGHWETSLTYENYEQLIPWGKYIGH